MIFWSNPMAPQVRALAQSESKARFMARLGLDELKDEHKQLYTMMKVGSSSPPSDRLGVGNPPAYFVFQQSKKTQN